MTNSKTTRKALLSSVLALTLCVAMLIATTFAWFTDTASTSVNKIQAGTLDVALEMATEWDTDGSVKTWASAEGKTLSWKQANTSGSGYVDGSTFLWEPGCTYNLQDVRVVNNGNLALKYQVQISGLLGNAKLLEAIDFTVTKGSNDPVTLENWEGTLEKGEDSGAITITGTMKTTAGNEYQGLSIDGIAITVVATQLNSEFDSNGNDYDKDAVLPVSAKAVGNLKVITTEETGSGAGAETTTTIKVEEAQTLSDSVMTVTYPENVLLESGTSVDGTTNKKAAVEQKLEYVDDTPSEAMNGVTISANKSVASYDLTLPVAESNTTLVTVTINYAKGLTGVKLYHNGKELETAAAGDGGSAHEYFAYDSGSGKITLYLFHASPIDIVYDKPGMATVTTAAELTAALADTSVGTIVLENDITTSNLSNATYTATIDNKTYENLPVIDHSVTIDLNEKTLTYTGGKFGVKDNGTAFIMKNGTFKEDNASLMSTTGVIVNFEGTTTTLNKVTATTDATLLFPWGDASSVNVIDSKINAGVYGIATNAGSGNKTGITINISDSAITTSTDDHDNCAVLMNVGGKVYITNSTITGERQGFFLRAGYAEVKHSTIKTTGQWGHGDKNAAGTKAYWKPDAEGNSDYWGTGNEVPRAALVVGTRDNTASGTWLGYSAKCYVTDSSTIVDGSGVHNIIIGWSDNSCGYCEQDTSSYTTNVHIAD